MTNDGDLGGLRGLRDRMWAGKKLGVKDFSELEGWGIFWKGSVGVNNVCAGYEEGSAGARHRR